MTIITEGLKEVLPLIKKFAPTINSILIKKPGISAASALCFMCSEFNTDTTDLKELSKNIISDEYAEIKLARIEKKYHSWLEYADNLQNLYKIS